LIAFYIKSKNIYTACYTNSIKLTAELMLEKTGILNLIDYLVTNQDVNNPKPDPEGYLKCINYFNITKNMAIIIEDSPKGIEAAVVSGAKVIQVKNPDEVCIKLFKDII
jgi:HAD superfamily hydrolase (TIGR01509 family)